MSYMDLTKGMEVLFDGHDLNSFVCSPDWAVRDGCIRFTGAPGQQSIFTKKDYSSFRVFVTMRILSPVTPNSSHLAVMMWGKRPAPGDYRSSGFISVIPPNAWMWDYKHNEWIYPQKRTDHGFRQDEWNEVEVLADIKTGHIRVAVNGLETTEYFYEHDLSELAAGSVAFQQHHDGIPEYKDIYIISDPEDADRLLTVR